MTLASLGGFIAATPASAAETACSACQPWWHLSSSSRPTNLPHGGTAVDEVQEITATPGVFIGFKGAWFTLEIKGVEVGSFATEELATALGLPEPTKENVQKALEEKGYGPEDVEVSGGPAGTAPLLVKTLNAGVVAPIAAVDKVPGGTAGATVTTEGSFHGPDIVLSATDIGGAPAGGCNKVAVAGTGKYNEGCTEEASPGTGEYESSPFSIADVLPAGIRAATIEGSAENNSFKLECSIKKLTCTDQHQKLEPFADIEVRIGVVVEAPVPGKGEPIDESESNEASVTGGGAPAASVRRPLKLSEHTTPYGVEDYEMTSEEAGGSADTQAGSHPFQLTTSIVLNQGEARPIKGAPGVQIAGATKDLGFHWPPGLIGNPNPLAHCSLTQFFAKDCPAQSVVGAAAVTVEEPTNFGLYTFTDPVFNMEPSHGEPARFAFYPAHVPIFIDVSVRSGSDYGVTVKVLNATQTATVLASVVSVWGVPGESSHNRVRGGCLNDEFGACTLLDEPSPTAFLQLPTACTGKPLQTDVIADSWEEPRPESEQQDFQGEPMVTLDGCNRLPFTPSIEVTPDGKAASSSTGMSVDVHVPQAESLNAEGLAESDPRGITVALPPGVQINPSGGDGLEACSGNPGALPESALAEGALGTPGDQIGYLGSAELASIPGTKSLLFSPHLPGSITALEAGQEGELKPGVNFCPDASKIGTAEIKTPVLPNPVKGAVYLASQNQNPFGGLLAMYLVAEDPISGVLVKLAGEVSLCKSTGEEIAGMSCQTPGQIIATFENSPQAPFEDAKLEFFGGERTALATPARCGTYTTQAAFTQWAGNAPVDASSTFAITEGPNHTPCPGASLPFHPTLTGGATNLNAGAFSPLTGTFAREDGEQNLSGAQFHLPPGLSGLLSSVKLCGEQQANEGTCGPESLVGETTVSAGVGSDPVYVKGGRVYITEKYHGAPFGVSVVDPVKAGPFDLEHDTSDANQDPACDCIVVRGRIEINPYTTALTITTNSEGEGYAIPHFIDGIPVQIKKVNFVTTRPGFQFNPTNCAPTQMTATIDSDEGSSDNVAVPFQVTNCAVLKFTPKFSVSTSGKTSKADGASLTAKVTEPAGALGVQANISKVKVELPKQLPSRLTTLQKACTAAQFEANPAGCPSPSVIGHAKVITPLIPVALEGPVYFVSHGGEAFPSLEIVLQGSAPYPIQVILVGSTFISKSGITSTTFKAVPDQPFNTFEITLPEGKYSALAANGNLCGQKLTMPNEFTGQNGLEVHESTTISVTGCGKVKALTRAQKLTAALKACHKDHKKGKREACEKAARKKFGPLKKAKKSKGKK